MIPQFLTGLDDCEKCHIIMESIEAFLVTHGPVVQCEHDAEGNSTNGLKADGLTHWTT